jgi:hypothetical protein
MLPLFGSVFHLLSALGRFQDSSSGLLSPNCSSQHKFSLLMSLLCSQATASGLLVLDFVRETVVGIPLSRFSVRD